MISFLSNKAETLKARRRLARKAGFSLMEVLIVLAIIALLAALVGPQLFKQLDKGKVTAATVQLKTFKQALDTMQLEIGRYPSEQEGLLLLVQSPGEGVPNWSGPYMATLPKDPWGSDYVYVAPAEGGQPQVGTLGSDRKQGGTGNAADIVQ